MRNSDIDFRTLVKVPFMVGIISLLMGIGGAILGLIRHGRIDDNCWILGAIGILGLAISIPIYLLSRDK